MTNINNKVKQKSAGNWGHPRKYNKKRTDLPKDFGCEPAPTHRSRKKKKTTSSSFPWEVCPFCETKLKSRNKGNFVLREYANQCHLCQARKVERGCPACKRSTWFKSGVYKHQYLGCGFTGKRKKLA